MKTFVLSTATILAVSLISVSPTLAQSERITCVRDRNLITCPSYGNFQYSSNRNNRSRANINCVRNANMITCPNYGNFRYSSTNNNLSNNTNEINTLYVQVLGRNATSNDLQNYRQIINNQGGSLEQTRRNLVNSPEFKQTLNSIYQQYLGRNANMVDLQNYRNAVANGSSFIAIKDEIANSPEAINRNQYNGNYNNGNYNRPNNNTSVNNQINDLYIQVLGRNPNATDLRNYRQAINRQGLSFEQARRNLVSSQEFNQSINQIYQQYLGRNADANGLQSYRNAVINGMSFEDVRNEIANSPEANNRNDNYNYDQPNGGSNLQNSIQDIACQLVGLCF